MRVCTFACAGDICTFSCSSSSVVVIRGGAENVLVLRLFLFFVNIFVYLFLLLDACFFITIIIIY